MYIKCEQEPMRDGSCGNIQYDLLQFEIGCLKLDIVQIKQG